MVAHPVAAALVLAAVTGLILFRVALVPALLAAAWLVACCAGRREEARSLRFMLAARMGRGNTFSMAAF